MLNDNEHPPEFYEEDPHRFCFGCDTPTSCSSCNNQLCIDEYDKALENHKKEVIEWKIKNRKHIFRYSYQGDEFYCIRCGEPRYDYPDKPKWCKNLLEQFHPNIDESEVTDSKIMDLEDLHEMARMCYGVFINKSTKELETTLETIAEQLALWDAFGVKLREYPKE